MDTVTLIHAAKVGHKTCRYEGEWYEVCGVRPGGDKVRIRRGNVTRDLDVHVPVLVRRATPEVGK